ncbi:MAG TPA: M1 family aminopeptidase [Polyangiaceae bacterium]|nr:M1 family aminopeptidase [Polyangiaceae bacterium]
MLVLRAPFARGLLLGALAAGSALLSCDGEVAEGPSPPPPEAAFDVEAYELAGEYDWARGRLVASLTLRLAMAGGPERLVALDSEVTEVKAVRTAEGLALPFRADRAQKRLEVDLPGAPAAGPLALVIDYEAAPAYDLYDSPALLEVPARAGDPIATRVVYTFSEPQGARQWLPGRDDPADRALFSVDLRVADGESLIANGDLVADEPAAGGGHRVRYATRYSLPTYLMAFAAGPFEVASGPLTQGGAPLSVWHRPGLPGDYDALLAELARLTARFEALTGTPYPFEKYALVLLPNFPAGGEEHAGITFQGETISSRPALASDRSLTAHELAHQWFGDLVTVKTWDDLWLKEGMASLLECEGTRVSTLAEGAGPYGGDCQGVRDGDAARDRSLAPGDKYTSGPYGRAAWVLSQLRALAGEEGFWGTWRSLLEAHRFGNLATEEFLDAFRPRLAPGVADALASAVDAKALPRLYVEDLGGVVRLSIDDPEGALVAPLSVARVGADGAAEAFELAAGAPVDLPPAPATFLVPDLGDLHPDFGFFFADDASASAWSTSVAGARLPRAAPLVERLAALPEEHQTSLLAGGELPPTVAPEAFAAFVASLDSDAARVSALRAGCNRALEAGQPAEAWAAAIGPLLQGEPYLGGLGAVGRYESCSKLTPPLALFAAEWAALRAGAPALPEPRAAFLAKFLLPSADALAVWSNVARAGQSTRLRVLGAQQLAFYAGREDLLPAAERPGWQAFAAGALPETEVHNVLAQLLTLLVRTAGATPAENAAGLDALARLLSSRRTHLVHARAVCSARVLTREDAAAWADFGRRVGASPLTPRARALLADPSGC